MVPSSVSTRPSMPVSSSTSRAAACCRVSPFSRWPLGRHHSMRPARLRRAITAIRATPSCTSTTMPPAERSSTAGSRRRRHPLGVARRGGHPATLTSPPTGLSLRAPPPIPASPQSPALAPVPSPQPPTALLQQAAAHLAPVRAAADRARRAVRRQPGTSSRWSGGPVRDAFLGRPSPGPRLHDQRHPGRVPAPPRPWARRALGHRARVRHDRRPARRAHGRGDELPRRRLRRPDPQAGRRLRRQPRGRPRPPRLHRERDGAAAAVAGVRRPVCRSGRPRARRAAHARRRPRCRSATTRCG